jgi:hypothetical protein
MLEGVIKLKAMLEGVIKLKAMLEGVIKLKAMLQGVITVWKLTSLDSVQRSQWRTGPPQQRV